MKKRIFKVMTALLFASTAITLVGCKKDKEQPHEHTYASSWSSNASEHWYAATCEHTDLKKDVGEHVYDDESDTTCNVCGYVRTVHTHSYAKTWTYDDTEHWHAATCEHTDLKKDVGAHTFDDGVITKDPDYGVDGEKTFTCTVCGKTKVETVAALVAFFMPIQDVFSVSGKVMVYGTIYSGTVKTGDTLSLSNVNKTIKIVEIQKMKKNYTSATAGEEISLVIEGATKDEIKRGYSLFTPFSKKYYNEIKVNLTSFTEAEGGKKTPFITKYKPVIKLYPATSDGVTSYAGEVMGSIILPNDLEMFMPGETHEVTIILQTKFILDKGMELIVYEGGKTVAHGVITGLNKHEHDNNYDEKGICDICGFDQYLTFNLEAGREEYSYTANLEVNNKIFFKITPTSTDASKEWRVDVDGASYEDYQVTIYDSKYNEIVGDMKTNSTYYIVVTGTNNVNDVTIKVIDSNAM